MFFTPWNPNKSHKLPAGPPAPILKMHPVPGGCSMSILGHDGKRYYQDGAPHGAFLMAVMGNLDDVAAVFVLSH